MVDCFGKRGRLKSRSVWALLALSFIGTAHPNSLLSLSPAWAQEANAVAPQLAVAAKTNVAATVSGLIQQEELCKTPITFTVQDANLGKVVTRIKRLLPPETIIELRNTNSAARFTLDLTGMPIGEVLESMAKLAQCKFYVLSDRLLITRESQLSIAERADAKDWAKNRLVAGMGGWSARSVGERAFSRAVFGELQGRRAAQGTAASWQFSDLSQSSQQMLQSMVNWTNDRANHTSVRVPQSAAVAIVEAGEAGRFSLQVNNLDSNGAGRLYYFYGMR